MAIKKLNKQEAPENKDESMADDNNLTEEKDSEDTRTTEQDEADDDSELNIPPVEVKTKKKPTVTVRTLRDHRCTIGGVTYEFEKGVETPVPAHVKMTLAKQNILKA